LWKKQKDNRPKILQPQGDYLYDKGENDERFHISAVASTDLQVYFITDKRKSKEKYLKIFFLSKFIPFPQKMLVFHICTRFFGFL